MEKSHIGFLLFLYEEGTHQNTVQDITIFSSPPISPPFTPKQFSQMIINDFFTGFVKTLGDYVDTF